MISAIVAADASWGIGKDGGLLYDLPTDRRYFRQMTLGGTLILGRKTLDSFPGGRPLPKRAHWVLSRSRKETAPDGAESLPAEELAAKDGIRWFPDLAALSQALDAAQKAQNAPDGPDAGRIFVAGGGSIYRQLLPWCDTCYVTHVEADAGADTYFPNLSADPDWYLESLSEPVRDGAITFRFGVWKRRAHKGGQAL